jgi:Fur family peroxide stress response transcriptional regulator
VPTVSLDTVYRTLALLEKRGLISKVDALSGRARYDANTDRHHHFICIECGLVQDLHDKALDNLQAPASAREFGAVVSAHVQFRGVCSRCAARKRRRTRGR